MYQPAKGQTSRQERRGIAVRLKKANKEAKRRLEARADRERVRAEEAAREAARRRPFDIARQPRIEFVLPKT